MRTKIFLLLLLMSVYLEMLNRPAFHENAGRFIINLKNTPFPSRAGRSGRRYGAYFAAKRFCALANQPEILI